MSNDLQEKAEHSPADSECGALSEEQLETIAGGVSGVAIPSALVAVKSGGPTADQSVTMTAIALAESHRCN